MSVVSILLGFKENAKVDNINYAVYYHIRKLFRHSNSNERIERMNFQITLYTGISIGFLLSAIHAQITLNGEFFTVEAIPIFLGIFGFLVGAAATVLYCLPKVDLKYQEDKSSESTQQKEEK